MKISNTVDTQELLTVLSKGGYLSVGGAPLKEILTRLEQAEQAVARVREVCESGGYEVSNEFGTWDAVAVENIIDSLDGVY